VVKEKKAVNENTDQQYKADYAATTKDWMTWYRYTYRNIRLAQDFTSLDVDTSAITKAAFLNKLSTGNFIALKVAKREGSPVYQLYPLADKQPDIQNTIKQMAEGAKALAAYEGKRLPGYSFTDINGTVYNEQNTTGKLLLIKCWFINCVACVKEFPELNALVDHYKNRQDLVFISLATDPKQNLQVFLQKKPFKYAVVPGAGDYMRDKLGITAYPTHFLVDRNGKVLKATNDMKDLLPSVEKAL
jgi:thiol-disulfide isomerase/thioredoxin